MSEEEYFVRAMEDQPADMDLRIVFADWLEERSDPRGALLRLQHALTQEVNQPDREQLESSMQKLLKKGARPVGPFWTNSVGMRFAWVGPERFLMGSPTHAAHQLEDETQHHVTITSGFYLCTNLVTQAQWKAIAGKRPFFFESKQRPVECISWQEAVDFCGLLQKADGRPYRLPTEAEWEYACRAGTTTAYSFGDDESQLPKFAWIDRNSGKKTHPVGTKKPNALGLHDMHGNLAEWCHDWYGPYPTGDATDPKGPASGAHRVKRSGAWFNHPVHQRSAYRRQYDDQVRSRITGFRVCFSLK
jgi:uncharacterized protein (TIGR02996 family)